MTQEVDVFVGHIFNQEYIDDFRDSLKNATKELGMGWNFIYADEYFIDGHILKDKIFNLIDNSNLCIFEITESTRPNVFIELGYAYGKGKKAILVSKDSAIIPSDLKGYERIIYSSYKQLTKKLSNLLIKIEKGENKNYLSSLILPIDIYNEHTFKINSLYISETHYLLSTSDRIVIIRDLNNNIIKSKLICDTWIGNGCILPDSQHVAGIGGKGYLFYWIIGNSVPKHKIIAHNGDSRAMTVSKELLITGGSDGKIKTWNPNDLSLRKEMKISDTEIRKVDINNQNIIIACDFLGRVYQTNTDLKNVELLFDNQSSSTIRCIKFSSINDFELAWVDDTGYIYKYDIRTNKIDRIKAYTSKAICCNFLPSDSILVTGSDNGIISFWDFKKNLNLITEFQGHSDQINSLAFEKEGKYLFSAGRDCIIKKWELEKIIKKI